MIWLRNKVNTKLQQLSGDTLRNINSASFLGCMLFLIIQSVFLIKLTQNDISLNFNSPAQKKQQRNYKHLQQIGREQAGQIKSPDTGKNAAQRRNNPVCQLDDKWTELIGKRNAENLHVKAQQQQDRQKAENRIHDQQKHL